MTLSQLWGGGERGKARAAAATIMNGMGPEVQCTAGKACRRKIEGNQANLAPVSAKTSLAAANMQCTFLLFFYSTSYTTVRQYERRSSFDGWQDDARASNRHVCYSGRHSHTVSASIRPCEWKMEMEAEIPATKPRLKRHVTSPLLRWFVVLKSDLDLVCNWSSWFSVQATIKTQVAS